MRDATYQKALVDTAFPLEQEKANERERRRGPDLGDRESGSPIAAASVNTLKGWPLQLSRFLPYAANDAALENRRLGRSSKQVAHRGEHQEQTEPEER